LSTAEEPSHTEQQLGSRKTVVEHSLVTRKDIEERCYDSRKNTLEHNIGVMRTSEDNWKVTQERFLDTFYLAQNTNNTIHVIQEDEHDVTPGGGSSDTSIVDLTFGSISKFSPSLDSPVFQQSSSIYKTGNMQEEKNPVQLVLWAGVASLALYHAHGSSLSVC